MGGSQKEIYDDTRDFLRNQEANIAYVDAAAGEALTSTLNNPVCYKGTAIQALKSDLYLLKDRVELTVLEERKAVIAAVDECAAMVAQTPEFQALSAEDQGRIQRNIDAHKAGLDSVKLIPVLRDKANGARADLLVKTLAEIERIGRPAPTPTPAPAPSTGSSTTPSTNPSAVPSTGPADDRVNYTIKPAITPEPKPTYIKASEIKVGFGKPFLTDVTDVEEYVDAMKKNLLEQIQAGKKVIV